MDRLVGVEPKADYLGDVDEVPAVGEVAEAELLELDQLHHQEECLRENAGNDDVPVDIGVFEGESHAKGYHKQAQVGPEQRLPELLTCLILEFDDLHDRVGFEEVVVPAGVHDELCELLLVELVVASFREAVLLDELDFRADDQVPEVHVPVLDGVLLVCFVILAGLEAGIVGLRQCLDLL